MIDVAGHPDRAPADDRMPEPAGDAFGQPGSGFEECRPFHRLVFPTERDRGNLASRRSSKRSVVVVLLLVLVGEPRRGFRRVPRRSAIGRRPIPH